MTEQDERGVDSAAVAAVLRLMGVRVTADRAQELAVQVARIERTVWAHPLAVTIEPWMPPVSTEGKDETPC